MAVLLVWLRLLPPSLLIRSHLLSSTKVTGGRNGYGAKLANIFSKEFIVETCDGSRKRRYRQASDFDCDAVWVELCADGRARTVHAPRNCAFDC